MLLMALTAAVAYYHYTQGFFSATISAILVTIAAVAAVGFHENAALWMVGGKFTEVAAAVALCGIFGVVYTALRFLFDALVPGNVRFPLLVDKIGAGAMGLWAGLIATGIIAVAAQTLPFGPDVGYYARYSIKDVTGQYMGMGQNQDVTMYDMTNSPQINPDDENHLLLHQDDLVLGLVYKLSDGGSLAGDRPMAEAHPDYLAELFGQRIGVQVGAERTLVGTPAAQAIDVKGVFTQPQLMQIDGEIPSLRPSDEQVQQLLQPSDADQQAMLIVRMVVSPVKDAADSDGLFRFSPGSIRLVAGHSDESGTVFKDYHPVATLDRRGIAVASRVDDFLFTPLSAPRTIDLIFIVDKDCLVPTQIKTAQYELAKGTFLEVKRYSTWDLSGKAVEYGPPTNKDKMGIMRKPDIDKTLASLGVQTLQGVAAPEPPQSGSATGDLGLEFQDVSVSSSIFTPIDVRMPGGSGKIQLPNGVSASWNSTGLTSLSIPMEQPVSAVSEPGTNLIDQFASSEDYLLVQFHMTVPRDGSTKKAWDWGRQLGDLTLVDTTDQVYKPVGAWARAELRLQEYIVASFDNMGNSFYPIAAQTGKARPTDVWIAFWVPRQAKLQELRLSDNAILEDLGLKVVAPAATTAPVPASLPAPSGAGSQ
ncbi:MAG: CvpA family protein [Tepidisphaeraceae bacterium]